MLPTAATQIRAVPIPSTGEISAMTACLSASEHRLMVKYRHERRRREFVAGRLALKRALLERENSAVRIGSAAPLPDPLLSAAQRLQALPDDDGCPKLWVEDAVVSTQVSIAHAAGWAAAACSQQPIGIDIVDTEVPVAIPEDDPWLVDVEPECRTRLRALLWGLRECLLKSGQIAAKTTWSLAGVRVVPTCTASEIIVRWPGQCGLAPLEVQVEDKRGAGAFVALSRSALLVMISMPAPNPINWMQMQ